MNTLIDAETETDPTNEKNTKRHVKYSVLVTRAGRNVTPPRLMRRPIWAHTGCCM